MSSYGAKGTRTPNNRLQRTVRYVARRTGAMGYVPDLHKIWVGTSDQQLMALSNEFPGFYRYALIRNSTPRRLPANCHIFRCPLAQFERRFIAERTRDGMNAARAKGSRH